jgi:hypothetical protein
MPIPRIIHQMGRDERAPGKWERFRETWRRHHPDWEHRFWTDQSLRNFVSTNYPDFLELYDAYPNPIMRADAARYLLLDQFGGIYADLDTECLKAFDPLLAGERLLLALEPDIHLESKVATARGLRRIVGNAWAASAPRHPFWEKVRDELKRRSRETDPLAATGPFMLSALIDRIADSADAPRLLPAETVYPATNLDREWLEAREPGTPHWFGPRTHAIHYWDGSWWRRPGHRTGLHLLKGTEPVLSGWIDEARATSNPVCATFNPLVSCLMVTGRRPGLAALAIGAFRRQSYPNRELVIIDDSGDERIGAMLGEGDVSIRWVRVPPESKPLGALRNRALAEAGGELLCQWDDDDLSAPGRIERQVRALAVTGADACGLSRVQLWWPGRDWIATSSNRLWECALLWRRGAIKAYPEIRSGEDTPPVKELAARGSVVMIEAPGLYTYIHHGQNTFSDAHWLSLWAAAGLRSTGPACRLKLQLMQHSLPCDEYLGSLGLPPLREPPGAPELSIHRAGPPSLIQVSAGFGERHPPAPDARPLPKILVATPIKDAVTFLERYFEALLATDYPSRNLALAFVESDSRDATAAVTQRLLERHADRFASTRLLRRDFGLQTNGGRWETHLQRRRRAVLARSRNLLVEEALGDEDWVLWIDVDVVSWPVDIFRRLLDTAREIVTPHCVREPGGPSYDLNTFVFHDRLRQDGAEHLIDGIHQPPRGATRRYLESFRDLDEVELDGVGGTMLLVRADLHRDGLRFPARPYHGFLETEGLAQMARDFGTSCWGLPQVEIVHS